MDMPQFGSEALTGSHAGASPVAIRRVLIIVAMKAEADPIIASLGLTMDKPLPIPTPTAAKTYSGQLKGISVFLAHNGTCDKFNVDKVGTNAATLTAYLSIAALHPDLVISAGTAGGFASRGATIGSIFVSTACVNHDRRIPLPGFDIFGTGREDTHPVAHLARSLGFREGVVSTGNSLDFTSECMRIMNDNQAAVKEMEAAAVAYVCRLWGTPMFAIKAVTDIVDGSRPPQEEFLENLSTAAAALEDAIRRVLEFLQGKSLEEL